MNPLQPEKQEIQYPKYMAYTGTIYEDFDTLLEVHPEISVDHPDYHPDRTYRVVYNDDREVMV